MREDYFIDQVDNEYCLRLKVNGYKIVILNGIDMEHKIGKIELRKIFGREICIYHQSPMRYYYRTRNLLFMIKDYKDRVVIIKVIKSLVKDFIKLLFEQKKYTKATRDDGRNKNIPYPGRANPKGKRFRGRV